MLIAGTSYDCIVFFSAEPSRFSAIYTSFVIDFIVFPYDVRSKLSTFWHIHEFILIGKSTKYADIVPLKNRIAIFSPLIKVTHLSKNDKIGVLRRLSGYNNNGMVIVRWLSIQKILKCRFYFSYGTLWNLQFCNECCSSWWFLGKKLKFVIYINNQN